MINYSVVIVFCFGSRCLRPDPESSPIAYWEFVKTNNSLSVNNLRKYRENERSTREYSRWGLLSLIANKQVNITDTYVSYCRQTQSQFMSRAFNPGGVKEFILHTMIGYGYIRYCTLDIKVRLSFITTASRKLIIKCLIYIR